MKKRTDRFDRGVLIGFLIARGCFSGDGKQPQVVIKMDASRRKLLTWLGAMIPGSEVRGPYVQGGKKRCQWMVRGKALREVLMPILREASIGRYDMVADRRIRRMFRENFPKCL